MKPPASHLPRRQIVQHLLGSAATLALPGLARAALPAMTEGPFYPSLSYRARQLDWDADLTQVARATGSASTGAQGEWLDLFGSVIDARGRLVDGAEVEIWQCDVYGSYRHPRGAGSRVDDGFQGFGSSRSDNRGRYRFRTIRPAPYPGRAPHIHVLLRHPSWGELASQLFVAGEPANDSDFLYRRLSANDRAAADMKLQAAPPGAPVRWLVERSLVVGT